MLRKLQYNIGNFMKKSFPHLGNKKIDYFEILSEKESRQQTYKMAKLSFTDNSSKKIKKVVPIVETEADRLRKTEIRAAKTEIYYLRTAQRAKVDYRLDAAMKNRREEIINCKKILSSELYR